MRRLRIPLNCLIVATYLWLSALRSHGRRYVWNRRSYKFRGKIIHAGVAEAFGWKSISVIDYIPDHKKLGTWENLVVLFVGRYRVWKLRPVAVRRFDTLEEAMAYAKGE